MSIVRRRPVLWGQPAADHHMHEPYLYDAQYHRPHYDPDTPGRTPMSGFSNKIVDEEFFSDKNWKSNFLCNLGIADESALFQKLPRFAFEDVCSFL